MKQDTNTHAQEKIDLKTINKGSSNTFNNESKSKSKLKSSSVSSVLICFLLFTSIIKNVMNLCTNKYQKFKTEQINEAKEAWFSRV